jgi:hypothetical protein
MPYKFTVEMPMKPARRIIVILGPLLLVLMSVAVNTWGKPVTGMADGPKGKIEFQTLTLSAKEFWSGVKSGTPVVISGDLTLPRGDGRVPAIVMSHGGGGISGIEEYWVRERHCR